MVVATDPRVVFEFTLKEDADNPEPTVFRLQALTEAEYVELQGHMEAADGLSAMAEVTYRWVRRKLVGWSNLVDRDGAAIEYQLDDEGVIPQELMDVLSPSWKSQMFGEITGTAKIDEPEGES